MRIETGGSVTDLQTITLFAMDRSSVPFQTGVQLQPVTPPPCLEHLPVAVQPGPPGSPDCHHTAYYGSVHSVGGLLIMWYLGADEEDCQRICLATSEDSLTWTKPELGCTAYHGSRNNNLVQLDVGPHTIRSCVVFHCPQDPDPAARFKLAFQCDRYHGELATASSPDGIHWDLNPDNPCGPFGEWGGGMYHGGAYHLTGQRGSHAAPERQWLTRLSPDFNHWSDSFCTGMQRMHTWKHPAEPNTPQVHLGASLWNRGNVIVALYGQWQGEDPQRPGQIRMNLGLALSSDGLQYHEPFPGFAFVDPGRYGAIAHGQGFFNHGDHTFCWCSPWPEATSDGIRTIRWQRDRFASASPLPGFNTHDHCAQLLSAPIRTSADRPVLRVNAEGLSPASALTVELRDAALRPLPGIPNSAPLTTSGYDQCIRWNGQNEIPIPTDIPVRLCFQFVGAEREKCRFYAATLHDESTSNPPFK